MHSQVVPIVPSAVSYRTWNLLSVILTSIFCNRNLRSKSSPSPPQFFSDRWNLESFIDSCPYFNAVVARRLGCPIVRSLYGVLLTIVPVPQSLLPSPMVGLRRAAVPWLAVPLHRTPPVSSHPPPPRRPASRRICAEK